MKHHGKLPAASPRIILLLLMTSLLWFAKGGPSSKFKLAEENSEETGFGEDLVEDRNSECEAVNGESVKSSYMTKRAAAIARKIVHAAEWAAISHISSEGDTKGLPVSFFISMADGLKKVGGGIPYFYMTRSKWEIASILKETCDVSIFVSKNLDGECNPRKFPIEDYRSEHVLLAGKFHEIDNSSIEIKDASSNFFLRHSYHMYSDKDDYFFAKFLITKIIVYHQKDQPTVVPLEDYYEVKIPTDDDDSNFGHLTSVNEAFLLLTVITNLLKVFM